MLIKGLRISISSGERNRERIYRTPLWKPTIFNLDLRLSDLKNQKQKTVEGNWKLEVTPRSD
ncbi:unnamed protein product [Brassica rapa subsp. trilocularis]